MNVPNYQILSSSPVALEEEEFLPFFLGATEEEAAKLYLAFEWLLKKMARSYSINTGLDEGDLFGEGIIGLARAKRDFDLERSEKFSAFAIIKIKDAMNDFVRNNRSVIDIPSYVYRANAIIQRIRRNVSRFKDINDGELYDLILTDKVLGVENLKSICKHSKLHLKDLVDRSMYVPSDVLYEEFGFSTEAMLQKDEENVITTVVISKLLDKLGGDDRLIAEKVMSGFTYEQVARELGKSPSWVKTRLSKMRRFFE